MTGRRQDGMTTWNHPHHFTDHTKLQPHQKYVYVLRSLSGMFVCNVGYGSHWDAGAVTFTCFKDAKDARTDPYWHNCPEDVAKCKIVRLTVEVSQAKVFD